MKRKFCKLLILRFFLFACSGLAYAGEPHKEAVHLSSSASVAELKNKTSTDDPNALTALAWTYYFDINTKDSNEKSFDLFQKAADSGGAEAQFQMGVAYLSGTAGDENPEKARDWFEKALASGNAEAGMFLGTIYSEGIAVPRNPTRAKDYYTQAKTIYAAQASKGVKEAFESLAGIRFYNLDAAEHEESWSDWYERKKPNKTKFSDAGSDFYNFATDDRYSVHYERIGTWNLEPVKKAAVLNVTAAQDILAYTYSQKNTGLPENSRKALEWFWRSAVHGDGTADYAIATFYDEGRGVKRDPEIARIFYRRAQRHLEKELTFGLPDTLMMLTKVYKYGYATENDVRKAKDLLEQGTRLHGLAPPTQSEFEGLPKNYWSAASLLLPQDYKRAVLGDVKAQRRMFLTYHAGYYVDRDPRKAYRWLTKLSDSGDEIDQLYMAQYLRYGSGVTRDIGKAIALYEKLAPEQSIDAYIALGDIYEQGDGVTQNPQKAQTMYKKAFDLIQKLSPDDPAYPYHHLGYLYENGFGVERDIYKALDSYRNGLEVNNTAAMTGLARIYIFGIGMKPDYQLGGSLLTEPATENTDAGEARTYLGILYLEGKGVDRDYSEALAFLENAARLKYPEALFRLGYMYQNGLGVSRDLDKAGDYYSQACERADHKACKKLESLTKD